MSFYLKRALMQRSIRKRNLQHPFDYKGAEGFSLLGADDPLLNNSYYFSAHSPQMSIFIRLGKRINQDETWFAIYRGGKMYSLEQELFPAGKGPIKVEKTGDNWTVCFEGSLNGSEKVSFSATFIEGGRPIDFTTDMPAVRMATGVANEKWSRAFFEGLRTISGQCHYEQEGTLEGEFTLGGERFSFSMPCVRDHSFGKRDWNYMNNHLWLMGVSQPVQFNYSLVSYPAMTVLETGNYRDGSGMHYMVKSDLDFEQIRKGTVPEGLTFNMSIDNGRTVRISARVLECVTYHFQNGAYTLHENIAEFTADGNTFRGIFEIGFNKDSERIFNGSTLEGIKR